MPTEAQLLALFINAISYAHVHDPFTTPVGANFDPPMSRDEAARIARAVLVVLSKNGLIVVAKTSSATGAPVPFR